MKNVVIKYNNGLNLYATLSVKANITGKIIVAIMILTLLTIYAFIASTITKEHLRDMLFPLILMLALILYFPVRYLLWNLFGKETLIVNTKTVSYSYDYGILKTNLKTIHFDKLATGFQFIKEQNKIKTGNLVFYNYGTEDNLPEIIHQTSVLFEEIDILEIDMEISKIFLNEFDENINYIPHSPTEFNRSDNP